MMSRSFSSSAARKQQRQQQQLQHGNRSDAVVAQRNPRPYQPSVMPPPPAAAHIPQQYPQQQQQQQQYHPHVATTTTIGMNGEPRNSQRMQMPQQLQSSSPPISKYVPQIHHAHPQIDIEQQRFLLLQQQQQKQQRSVAEMKQLQRRAPEDPPALWGQSQQQQQQQQQQLTFAGVAAVPQEEGSSSRSRPTFRSRHHPNQNNTVDVPKIELSTRQQQLLLQRKHQQQRQQQQQQQLPLSNVPTTTTTTALSSPNPFQTRSNVAPVPLHPAAAAPTYNEPWEKPFLQRSQQQPQQAEEPRKTLVQSVRQHPANRNHRSNQPVVEQLQQQQQQPRSDPPTASEVHTHRQMDTQRAFIRNLLMKKHSHSTTTTTTAPVTTSHPAAASGTGGSSTHSKSSFQTNKSSSSSPQALLKRVLQKAASQRTNGSTPLKQQQHPNPTPQPLQHPPPPIMSRHPTTTNTTHNQTVSTTSLQEQMRQRFHQNNRHHRNHHPVSPPDPSTQQLHIPTTPPVAVVSSSDHETMHPILSSGYDSFVESLMKEVSSHHSQLYASFVLATTTHSSDTVSTTRRRRNDILQECVLSPKGSSNHKSKVDKEMIQKLHLYLQRHGDGVELCRPISQLMNDKQYHASAAVVADSSSSNSSSSTTTKQPSLSSNTTDLQHVSSSDHRRTKVLRMEDENNDDPVMHTRSSSSSSDSNDEHHHHHPTTLLHTTKSVTTLKPRLSVEIPFSRSIDSNDTTTVTSSTVVSMSQSSTQESSTQKSHLVPMQSSSQSSSSIHHGQPTTTTTDDDGIPWKRIQLRNVANDVSVSTIPHPATKNHLQVSTKAVQPEWASITLRPVSCRSDGTTGNSSSSNGSSSSNSSPVAATSLDRAVPLGHTTLLNENNFEQMTMHEIMEHENPVLIRLKRDGNCTSTEHHPLDVVSKIAIGPTTIRQIEYHDDAADTLVPTSSSSSQQHVVTVLWTIPRSDIEPDGMTLNMPTLKVTLILRPGRRRPSNQVLCFENSEDCLRFATAFYNLSSQQPSLRIDAAITTTHQSVVPPMAEVQHTDHASLLSDENSSVRMAELLLNDEEQVVLERYRELRQTKPASDALHETIGIPRHLQQDGISHVKAEQHLIQILRPTTNAPPSIVSAGELPSSPISTFTATTVGEVKTSADPPLTDIETQSVNKYKLMLQRGVPPDAVRHKMTQDQMDMKILAIVLAQHNDDATTSTVEPSTTTFGPNKAVHSVHESSLSPEDNVIAEKYRKMLKLRIPVEGVRHKMIQDQVDAKIVSAVLGIPHISANNEESSSTVVTTKTTGTKSCTVLSDEEESLASQYRKLLKINVSKDALLSRMQQEGVSAKIITAILGLNALNSLSGEQGGGKEVSGSGPTGSKLIPINWDHTENAIAGSVWEVWQNAPDPEPMDFTQLKQIFQRKERNAMKRDTKNLDPTHGVGKAKLLDITRSNNIAISLKAFKEFSHEELAEVVRFLDPTRKIRGERAHFIRDLLPTLTEIKIMDEYTGTDDRLVPAELWFRHLRGIKRIERKARILRTMEMFTSDATEIRDNFRLLSQVCRQVMASTKLQDVLGMVLRIGNVMNEGTRNGRAAGFKFNSLLRLTQTKTADGKITVLDYLVTVFVEKGESHTLDLISGFPDCHKASRFLISDMTNEVKSLKESLHQCKLELADLDRDTRTLTSKQVDNVEKDTRSQLFASIIGRTDSMPDESIPAKKTAESFSKRDEFLAAVKGSKKDASVDLRGNSGSMTETDDETKRRGSTNTQIENSLAGGMLRLRNFIEVVELSFVRLEKQRDEALEACKDLSRYCGEAGGVGVTISLLDILSQFAKNLEDAHKKYHEQQLNEARKQKVQEAKDIRSVASIDSSVSTPKGDGKSIVLLVNDILKNANPRFKEDFKKGRVLQNPSESLMVIYERERIAGNTNEFRKLDIVSAIQQREENVTTDEIEKARSTFAGVRPLPDDSSPRGLTIDPTPSSPPTNIDSPSECTSPILKESSSVETEHQFSVKERALLLNHSIVPTMSTNHDAKKEDSASSLQNELSIPDSGLFSVNVKEANKLMVNPPDPCLLSPSKENLRNATPKESNIESSADDFVFDLRHSNDRLRSRRSLSPSKVANGGSLAEVMKSLEKIKEHSLAATSIVVSSKDIASELLPPSEEKIASQLLSPTSDTSSPLPDMKRNSNTIMNHERKSITERARDKRMEKQRSMSSGLHATQNSILSPTLNGGSASLRPIQQRRVTMDLDDRIIHDAPSSDAKESAMARLARQKRLQKRMSR